jgi:hypothetical protein
VNFFLFLANGVQVARVVSHRRSIENTSVATEAKDVAKDAENVVEGLVKDPKGAVQAAVSK